MSGALLVSLQRPQGIIDTEAMTVDERVFHFLDLLQDERFTRQMCLELLGCTSGACTLLERNVICCASGARFLLEVCQVCRVDMQNWGHKTALSCASVPLLRSNIYSKKSQSLSFFIWWTKSILRHLRNPVSGSIPLQMKETVWFQPWFLGGARRGFRNHPQYFHLFKNMCYLPLLVLKGIYHYWKYVYFSPAAKTQMEEYFDGSICWLPPAACCQFCPRQVVSPSSCDWAERRGARSWAKGGETSHNQNPGR